MADAAPVQTLAAHDSMEARPGKPVAGPVGVTALIGKRHILAGEDDLLQIDGTDATLEGEQGNP
jgi:hypothetical protein